MCEILCGTDQVASESTLFTIEFISGFIPYLKELIHVYCLKHSNG